MTFAASAMQNPGEVFTRRWVVEVLLDLTGYTADCDLGQVRLLEPSCGSGAFLSVVLERLIASAHGRGRDLASLGDAIRAYDLQAGHVEVCRALCRDQIVAAGESVSTASALAERWVQQADFLLADMLSGIDDSPADVVIGNPPYIRYDDLADDLVALYRSTWPTMRGRGDIYIGFIERSLGMLKPGGRLGFICADRWMRNQYGEPLRELVSRRYAVEHVWTMHDVDAFEEQVSAYPAIIGARQPPAGLGGGGGHDVPRSGLPVLPRSCRLCRTRRSPSSPAPGVTAHRLPHWFEGGEFWPTGSPIRLALLEYLNDRFGLLDDPTTGTKVSIGVASGADKVYVTKDPTVAEADRMLPLAMRRDLMSGKFEWQGNYLVNPWADDGKLVPLEEYPRMAAYLSGHAVLRERFVAKKAPGSWYRTIDKVDAKLTGMPKLLLQDMKAHIHPVLEPGGHYPHHNLYYVVSDTWDMEVLGGILLSRIAQAFIEAYCVRMRGDTLRFQAQYLKRIRVPQQNQIEAATKDALRAAFRSRDVDAATLAASAAYGIEPKDYDLA